MPIYILIYICESKQNSKRGVPISTFQSYDILNLRKNYLLFPGSPVIFSPKRYPCLSSQMAQIGYSIWVGRRAILEQAMPQFFG